MSRTYHTKKSFKQKMEKIRQERERLSAEKGVTIVSTLNLQDEGYQRVKKSLNRHSGRTKASGLRRELRGKLLVYDDRDRSGDAYQQSSRMRRMRKAGKHAFRLRSKKETRDLNEEWEKMKNEE